MTRKTLDTPEIVVLCGSTRFFDAFAQANYDLTLEGRIVLTVGCDTKSDQGLGITDQQKSALDELHKRKIDLADRVLVLNVGGYIGSSTRSEIAYAEALGKPVSYLVEERRQGFDPDGLRCMKRHGVDRRNIEDRRQLHPEQ